METISITSKNKISLADVNQALAHRWRVEGAGNNRLVIQEQNNRVYLYLGPSEEKVELCQQLLIDYSDIELVKKVIQVIGNSPEMVIDNDFGTVLPGDKFVARIESAKGWNWRDRQSK
jgi:hypothetical protein